LALQRFTSQWSEKAAVPVDFHSHGLRGQRLPIEYETTLYRVTQEALTNIARHAAAHHVSLLLERRSDLVSLIIEDDGNGFDTEIVVRNAPTRGSLGLLGMQERVKLVGGGLEIESTAGAGTTIFVRLPLQGPAGGDW
jgi:signal transduction histidine kinase